MTLTALARIVHELNRAYCQALGDHSQVPYDEAPDWQVNSVKDGVRHHLSRYAVGLPTSPESSHENWLKTKTAEGWSYGPVKDATKKVHPCFVPYAELPETQRLKDVLFVNTVYALASLVIGDVSEESATGSALVIESTNAEAAPAAEEYTADVSSAEAA